MTLDNLRFELRVIDTDTGETVVSDYTHITPINVFGASESVDIHVASALRCVRKDIERSLLETA